MQNGENNGKIHGEYAVFRGRGSLADMVRELERQAASAVDFVADTRDMHFVLTDKGTLAIAPANDNLRDFLPQDGLPCLDQALQQIAFKAPIKGGDGTVTGIPVKFFKHSLACHPARTLDYLNGVMHDSGRRRLVRCLDDHCRAFLSDQYRVIDTLGVAKHALKILRDVGGGKVLEASVTDSHCRIKMVSTEIWDRIEQTRTGSPNQGWYSGGIGNQEYLSKVAARSWGEMPDLNSQGGDGTVWPVATIGNSETGHGGMFFRAGFLLGVCFNLATVEEIVREVHLGSRLETGIYQRDTVEAEAEAIFLKLRDNMTQFFTPEKFKELIAKVRGTTKDAIEKPSAAVNLIVKETRLSEQDGEDILAHFMTDYSEKTVYGLGQAIARYSQDTDDAEKAEELELLAGAIMSGKHTKGLVNVS